jgi:uncharacterized protein YndB with AHSA1/START domain
MIEVSTHIGAPAERVWELIGDPSRMGEWSPECHRVSWVRPVSAPAVGARFRGHNRRAWRRWSTISEISSYDPGREIAWESTTMRLPIARWSYAVEPSDGGCTLTERCELRAGLFVQVLGGLLVRGVRDVENHNRAGMQQTLARIRAAAEAPATV